MIHCCCGSPSSGALEEWDVENTASCISFHPLFLMHFWHKLMLTLSALIYNMLCGFFSPPSFETPFRGVEVAAAKMLQEHSSLKGPWGPASNRAALNLSEGDLGFDRHPNSLPKSLVGQALSLFCSERNPNGWMNYEGETLYTLALKSF